MTGERDLINRMAYKEKLGETRGLKKGVKTGKEQGIEENKIATAKKMLFKNYSIDEISDITGLSKESIEEISCNSQDFQQES